MNTCCGHPHGRFGFCDRCECAEYLSPADLGFLEGEA